MTETTFAGVRMARPEDEERVYDLLMLLYAENALFPLSEKKIRAAIRMGTRGQGGIVGIIDGPDGIEASIGLGITSFWYTEHVHLNEYWIFVHPDHRRTTHLKRLAEFGKWCADNLSTPEIRVPLLLGVITRDRLLPKLRLFQRQAPQVGAIFMYGIDTSDTFAQRKLGEMPHSAGSVPVTERLH